MVFTSFCCQLLRYFKKLITTLKKKGQLIKYFFYNIIHGKKRIHILNVTDL